jgi:nitroreductase
MLTARDKIAFVRSVRSVRRFAATPLSDDVLRDVLDAGRWTGSSKNTQPWEMVVVRDRASLQALAGLAQFTHHLAGAAAALLLVMKDENRALDEGRLVQQISLAAWAYGVGSCIGTFFPEEASARAKDRLGVPPERRLRTALSLGYPADRNATRRSAEIAAGRAPATGTVGRKPLADVVHWERYGQH